MPNGEFNPEYSSNSIYYDTNFNECLTAHIEDIESDIALLQTGKANTNHTHTEYAPIDHTHTGYATEGYVDTHINGKVDKVDGKELSANDYTDAEKSKLSGIESGAQKNTVTGINGNTESVYRTGAVNITLENIGAAASSHTHDKSQISGLVEPSDYVVANGSSGQWTYRKWNSGTYECWRQITGTITNSGSWNGFRIFSGSADWPTGAFIYNPTVLYNCYIGSGYAIASRGGLSTTTQFKWSALGTDSDPNIGYCIYVYAIGRWK